MGDAGAALRGGHPTFLRTFRLRLISMKKGWGGGSNFFLLKDWYPFPLVYNSMIRRGLLVCVVNLGLQIKSILNQ